MKFGIFKAKSWHVFGQVCYVEKGVELQIGCFVKMKNTQIVYNRKKKSTSGENNFVFKFLGTYYL